MNAVTAEVVWENHGSAEEQIKLSTGHEFHCGGQADGFCYVHQSFKCIDNITDEEQEALRNADYRTDDDELHPLLCDACGKPLYGGPADHLPEDQEGCPAWGTPEHLQGIADHESLHEDA